MKEMKDIMKELFLKTQLNIFPREASMKSEKREEKNENRKMKTPVYYFMFKLWDLIFT